MFWDAMRSAWKEPDGTNVVICESVGSIHVIPVRCIWYSNAVRIWCSTLRCKFPIALSQGSQRRDVVSLFLVVARFQTGINGAGDLAF